jgi:transcriptional regulator with XRE-family HTH domain
VQSELGKRLRLIRAERKLSLRQAAREAGLAKETLGDVERGKRRPSDVTLAKLAEVYDVPLQELFDLEEEDYQQASPLAEPRSKPGASSEAPEEGPSVEEASDKENRRVLLNYLKAWPRYIDKRAEVFERELESFPAVPPLEDMPTLMPRVMEMYDELTDLVSTVDWMLDSGRRPLEQVSEEEKKDLRKLGEAIDRLMASERRMHVIIESAWARKEEAAATEQRRREHEEKQARLQRSLQLVQGELQRAS